MDKYVCVCVCVCVWVCVCVCVYVKMMLHLALNCKTYNEFLDCLSIQKFDS